jgi:hypothetical protein
LSIFCAPPERITGPFLHSHPVAIGPTNGLSAIADLLTTRMRRGEARNPYNLNQNRIVQILYNIRPDNADSFALS